MCEENKWCVYVHTNKINGKKYVGISSNIKKRWSGNGYNYQTQLFGRAINKYGWDNFDHIILYSDLSEVDACKKEIELIQEYDTCNPNHGYNVSPGGGELSPTFYNDTFYKKKIFQYTLQGDFVAEYESISDASKLFGHNISACISNKCRTSASYQWFDEYKGEKIPSVLSREEAISVSQYKEIYQYSLEGVFLNRFVSIKEASEKTGIERTGISNCINGKRKNNVAHGFQWYSEYKGVKIEPTIEYNNKPKKVYQYTLDGQYIRCFNSIRAVDREYPKSYERLRKGFKQNPFYFGSDYIWSCNYYPDGITDYDLGGINGKEI